MYTAYIGLGGNIGDTRQTLSSGIRALASLAQTRVQAISSLYRSVAIGPGDQADYCNAVVGIYTRLTPHELLRATQEIENAHGRERLVRWGPRTLDLDLLIYANDIVATADLILPHPELCMRNFVLVPLLEIAPALQHPLTGAIAALPAAHDMSGLSVLVQGSSWTD